MLPLSEDLEAAARLGRAAILARPWVGARGPELADQFETTVRGGERAGALFRRAGTFEGVATWEVPSPLGAVVHLLYLAPEVAAPPAYEVFWYGICSLVGPIAFAPGEIAGLSEPDEVRLMQGLGLKRFGRSEMRWRPGAPVPPVALPRSGTVRPIGRNDASELARLHRLAYHARFDRYLFLEEEDEARDSERMLTDLFAGRWGEYAEEGSWGLESDGHLIGAVLSVRRPDGILIADVMVDPSRQRQGIGAAVLGRTLEALRAAGTAGVYLNVTEGNDSARRLYERLGFERTLGPSIDWYDPRIIPAAP